MQIIFPIVLKISDSHGQSWQSIIEATGQYSVGNAPDNDVVLDTESVYAHHLTIDVTDEFIVVRPATAGAEFTLNGRYTNNCIFGADDEIGFAGNVIHWEEAETEPEANPPVEEIELSAVESVLHTRNPGIAFPSDAFLKARFVRVASLTEKGSRVVETDFAAVGGGIGSFTWVDHLRILGVSPDRISVIGIDPVCYGNYKRYCTNSQIPDHERLRSNSQSTPDNIWGFPGYASRETLSDLRRFKLSGLKHVFQVFGEPTLAESFTPRAGRVFESLDREMNRIGWTEMFVRGRVLAIRKTDDGRYAIALRHLDSGSSQSRNGFIVARHIHVATGYPTTRFVGDFRRFIAEHPASRDLVANAYEEHDRIYRACETSSDDQFVVVRGRGIVASRVIQRLAEARAHNPKIKILHSVRAQRGPSDGSIWERARRQVRSNVELQPFNWPKACWSGDLRQEHEDAGVGHRSAMINTLGGTTTADRADWQDIIARGTEEGWYRPVYGTFHDISPRTSSDGRKGVRIEVATPEGHCEVLNADFLIDCTGLIGDVTRSPMLADLIETYALPRSIITQGVEVPASRGRPAGIKVSESFEVEALGNGPGTVWASGTITTGGPYLAVDSFLGLQYAAFRATDALARRANAPLRKLRPLNSFKQWARWCANQTP